MKKHYILIDYENVQTKSLSVLQGAPNQEFVITVFVGANQSKIPIELVSSMQSFGDKAEYVQITGSGRNALDFHIAYYLGALTERDPKGIFHVISKDTGYDSADQASEDREDRCGEAKGPVRYPVAVVVQQETCERADHRNRQEPVRTGQFPAPQGQDAQEFHQLLFGNKLETERIDSLGGRPEATEVHRRQAGKRDLPEHVAERGGGRYPNPAGMDADFADLRLRGNVGRWRSDVRRAHRHSLVRGNDGC